MFIIYHLRTYLPISSQIMIYVDSMRYSVHSIFHINNILNSFSPLCIHEFRGSSNMVNQDFIIRKQNLTRDELNLNLFTRKRVNIF